MSIVSLTMDGLHYSIVIILLILHTQTNCINAYENFTVGGTEGWTPKPLQDYTTWASGKNFSLGDYLIFKYVTDYNVILTYNATVYERCDYINASDSDFEVWGEAGISTLSEIPLVEIGPTFFFCGTNDSIFCLEDGMKFSINVTQGEGLPPSLLTPPSPPPSLSPTSPSPPKTLSSDKSGNNFASHLHINNDLPYVVMALISCLALLPLPL